MKNTKYESITMYIKEDGKTEEQLNGITNVINTMPHFDNMSPTIHILDDNEIVDTEGSPVVRYHIPLELNHRYTREQDTDRLESSLVEAVNLLINKVFGNLVLKTSITKIDKECF